MTVLCCFVGVESLLLSKTIKRTILFFVLCMFIAFPVCMSFGAEFIGETH